MASFLDLVVDLHREVGAAGTAPTAVTNQTGEALRLVEWIILADNIIQTEWTRWQFLRTTNSDNIVATDQLITKPALWKQWDLDTMFLDTDPITVVHYDKVKSEYYDTTITDTPNRLIVMPNGDLRIDPVSNASFTLTNDFYARPTLLAANADISAIPVAFHHAILGRAIMLYANYEDAPEAEDHGKEIYAPAMARLQDDQLPNEDNAQYKGSGGIFEIVAE